MSEDAKQPPAGEVPADPKPAPAPAPAPARAPAKQRAPLPPFVVPAAVVALSLAAGVALGAFVLAPPLIRARQAATLADAQAGHGHKGKHAKDGDKKGGKDADAKPPVYKLDNIVVNPADSEGQRFLMCSVAIESDDKQALDVLRGHEVEVRDRVVSALASRSLSELTSPGARDSLRVILLATIKPVLGDAAQDADLKVFLPQFVVQ